MAVLTKTIEINNLKDLRAFEGYTLKEVAGELGITVSYLSLIESGNRRLTPSLAEKLAAVYGVDKRIIEQLSKEE